jgi:hypothetical protein
MLTLHWPLNPCIRPNLQRAARWIFILSNRERTLRSLRAVERHARLDDVAAFHCEDMVKRGYFEHLDPEGNGPQDRMQRLCPELIGGSGENLSMITAEQEEALARDVVDGWMHSPGHRKNLLSVTHTHMGIHLRQAGWRVYATQFFADLQVELLECRLPLRLRTSQKTALRFRYYESPCKDVAILVRLPNPEAWVPSGNGKYLKWAAMLQPRWESATDFCVDFQALYGPGLYQVLIGKASTSMYARQGIDVSVV